MHHVNANKWDFDYRDLKLANNPDLIIAVNKDTNKTSNLPLYDLFGLQIIHQDNEEKTREG